MKCISCNYSLKGDERYCPNCGYHTDKIEPLTIDNTHQSTENFRMASIILGVISLAGLSFLIFAPVSLILSILGLIFAIKSHRNSNNTVGIVINGISLFLASIITIVFALLIGLTVDVIKDVGTEYGNYIEDYHHGDF